MRVSTAISDENELPKACVISCVKQGFLKAFLVQFRTKFPLKVCRSCCSDFVCHTNVSNLCQK